MRALFTAAVYFGTFLAVGYVARKLLARWMARHGEDLAEIQAQGRNGGRQDERFLLGVWYREGR
jgi:hypothetical protein